VKDKLKWIPLGFLIFVTLWLRLVNLGYSDYQGDEIKALWRPEPGQSALDFLYYQKKGPVEFLVTYLMKLFDPTFSNMLLQRLPFALAGILAIYFFYRLVQRHYGEKIALYASLFFSVNGIFIGLMRIVQYQPFVLLFAILTLYCFTLALQEERWKIRGIYAGVFFWTAALFSHYDGAMIAPFAFYLLWLWYKQPGDMPAKVRLKHLVIPFALSGLLLAVYFIPYVFALPGRTKGYWAERITGEGDTGKLVHSSISNFELYNPLLGMIVYPILGILSLPRIKKTWPLVLWFALPFAIMEFAIFDPGTHIYTYILPAMILCAFGLEWIEGLVIKVAGEMWGVRLNIAGLALLFASLAGISHLIFVDHTPEYPFEPRGILFWKIGGANPDYKLWTFGFPYYRRWQDIEAYVTTQENNGYYATNEDVSISGYYVPYTYHVEQAGYYIYIYYPQSFRIWDTRDKLHYWREKHPPIKVFEYEGRVVAEIYSMPSGSLEEIKRAGY
jgi:4-amino-4-deoxy-L-arabinose transferase-like glycosyltransferase